MWGHEPIQKDLVLAKGADFIQGIEVRDPVTNEPFTLPAGSRVFFRIDNLIEWEGEADGSEVSFKVESEVTDLVKRGASVQFCISLPDGSETNDWVITTGRVVRV